MDTQAGIPGTKAYMLNCSYWLDRLEEPDKIIMSKAEIEQPNKETLKKVKSMCNLREYKEKISGEEIKKSIEKYKIPSEVRYHSNGKEMKKEFYEEIIKNINLDEIKETRIVSFGIVIRNTSMRSFPTEEGSFKEKENIEFDRFQETECQALNPVVVLHESRDKKWFFIQMYNYNGWVKACDIALAKNKEEIFEYVDAEDFLMVIGNKISTQFNHYDTEVSRRDFYMGTKIPIEKEKVERIGNQSSVHNYVVKLPVRDSEGALNFKNALISHKEEVFLGNLPYTRSNILKQAFKRLGDRYDWGNKNNDQDCSSFMMYVYKTFGFILPRNVNEQEMAEGTQYNFDQSASVEERNRIFKKAKPGAAIFMKGHVMLYIGEENGEAYMIHDFHRYGVKTEECVQEIDVNEVAVTSTLLSTVRGNKFIEEFTSLLQFEK